jgi:hypothetical protein
MPATTAELIALKVTALVAVLTLPVAVVVEAA